MNRMNSSDLRSCHVWIIREMVHNWQAVSFWKGFPASWCPWLWLDVRNGFSDCIRVYGRCNLLYTIPWYRQYGSIRIKRFIPILCIRVNASRSYTLTAGFLVVAGKKSSSYCPRSSSRIDILCPWSGSGYRDKWLCLYLCLSSHALYR